MRRTATKAEPVPARVSGRAMARSGFQTWLVAASLVLVTIALYWPATGHDFVNYDDPDYVTSNPHVQRGLSWEGVKWACLNPVADNWHPLAVWSHMFCCQVFGLNPWGHHLANVVLHVLNAALVFALLQQMTAATWRSLLVAALFAVHPLRVESVAWVSERKDVLSGFFGLLALIAYVRYAKIQSLKSEVQSPKPKVHGPASFSQLPASSFYLLSLFFFALGLMSKPMLVTWPFVMLLVDYWPLNRNAERGMRIVDSRTALLPLLVEKLPFLALSAIASIVTLLVQQRGGSLALGVRLPLSGRGANALISYGRYLGKMFWPTDLAVFYPHPGQWPFGKVLLAGGLVLGISVLVWAKRQRSPYLLVGWLWFIGMLVPVIGLVQTGGQAMADRHTYIPSLGVLILTVWGSSELTRRWRYQVLALSVAGGVAIVLCLALTRQQMGYWKDSEYLFRHALEVTEHNDVAHNGLGVALDRRGQIDEAIRQYQEAIRLKPAYIDPHYNLGYAFGKQGQIDEAINQYQIAIRLRPDYAPAHNGLGNALRAKGLTDDAIHELREALRLNPDHAEAYNDLGIALGQKGQMEEAIRQFRDAIRLKPDSAEAHNNLGATVIRQGQIEEAIHQFQEAIRLKPDYARAHFNLGSALDQQGQMEEAIRQFQEAVRLKPDDVDAHNHLGSLLVRQGQIDEAIRQFQEAIRLQPDNAMAHNNLGIALVRKGQVDEAIRQFQVAIDLKPDYAAAHNNLRNALLKKRQTDGANR